MDEGERKGQTGGRRKAGEDSANLNSKHMSLVEVRQKIGSVAEKRQRRQAGKERDQKALKAEAYVPV